MTAEIALAAIRALFPLLMALSSLAVVLNAARLARHRPLAPLQTGC